MRKTIVVGTGVLLVALSTAYRARADNGTWTMPYGGGCTSAYPDFCAHMDNTGSGGGGGLRGTAGSGYGVEGHSGSGPGVHGDSTSDDGVLGSTSTGTAVYANGGSGIAVFALGPAGGTTNWNGGSDIRLKKDVNDSNYGIGEVLRMRPVTYKLKEGDDRTHVGFIAQEVQKIVPEVVKPLDSSGMLGIEYGSLVPVLVKAAQEQQALIVRQQERIAALEGHGRSLSSAVMSSGACLALGLVPFGFVAARRRRRVPGEQQP